MFRPSMTFKRLLAATTAFSLVAPILPAQAQDDSAATPPARVGEIAAVQGTVNFNGAGSNGQWVAASANYPLTSGDSVFTQPSAQATLAVDSSRITLSGNTEFQITGLDDNNLAATASQGETFLAINYLQPGQSFAITTPRGTVTISQNGNYDIAAGDTNDPTVVTVLAGAATVTDPGATLQVQAGQAGVLSGTDQTVAQLGTAQRDDFINTMLAETAPPPPAYAPPVVQQMTGVAELANYGSWNQDPTYGAVWYPQVAAGWAPYHVGHWAYVAPWGYTWVDAAPWGFAPFHYGRWVDFGNRWGWAPAPAYEPGGGYGPAYRPVYAPALVSFFGIGAGVAVGVTIGALAAGSIGWLPLGPNEPYYPSYHYSPAYLQRINYVNVRNVQNINIHNTTINNYYGNFANRRAAVYGPADALSRGERVSGYAHPVPQDQFARARPIAAAYATPGGPHDALPPPNFVHRAVAPPHLDPFATRRNLPPAVVSHEPAPPVRPGQPFAGPHPGEAGAPPARPAMTEPPRPGFATAPGYHAPPPPPGGQHLNPPDNGQRPQMPTVVHPQVPQMNRPETPGLMHPPAPPQTPQHEALPQVFHPQVPNRPEAAPRPPMPQVFQPHMQQAPEQPQFNRPVAPPQPPAFHPQQMQMQQMQQMQRQEQRPEPPRPAPPEHEEQKKPGQP